MVTASDLSAVPLFAELDEPQLAELARWFEEREVDAETRLTGEGASGYSFNVLTGGAAAVTAEHPEIADSIAAAMRGRVAV